MALDVRVLRMSLAVGFASFSSFLHSLSSDESISYGFRVFVGVVSFSSIDRAYKFSSLNTWVVPLTIASTTLSDKNGFKWVL